MLDDEKPIPETSEYLKGFLRQRQLYVVSLKQFPNSLLVRIADITNHDRKIFLSRDICRDIFIPPIHVTEDQLSRIKENELKYSKKFQAYILDDVEEK